MKKYSGMKKNPIASSKACDLPWLTPSSPIWIMVFRSLMATISSKLDRDETLGFQCHPPNFPGTEGQGLWIYSLFINILSPNPIPLILNIT